MCWKGAIPSGRIRLSAFPQEPSFSYVWHVTTGEVESPDQPPADRRTVRGSGARFAVHLGLLCSAAASIGTLQLLHVRIAYHTVVGLVFVGLVVVHLVQRRC